jgi:hypothetical protein
MNRETNLTIWYRIADAAIRGMGLLFLALGALKFHGIMLARDTWAAYVHLPDAIFSFFPNSTIFTLAALCELVIGMRCLRHGRLAVRASLLLWFAGGAFVYKIGLIFVKYSGPCGCLFGINRFLPLSTSRQRWISDIILVITVIISLAVIVYDRWLKSREQNFSMPRTAEGDGTLAGENDGQ